jgi:hypothetical protein
MKGDRQWNRGEKWATLPESGGVPLYDVPRLPVRVLEHLSHLGVFSGLGGHSQDAAQEGAVLYSSSSHPVHL